MSLMFWLQQMGGVLTRLPRGRLGRHTHAELTPLSIMAHEASLRDGSLLCLATTKVLRQNIDWNKKAKTYSQVSLVPV